jgi:hypothetical protein
MKTLIGVPCGNEIKSRTAFSLFNLKGQADLVMQMGCDVADNRNKLAKLAIEKGYDHLLFIDSDMVVNPNTLSRMLALKKPIVGLAANHRRLPLESNVKPLDGDITKPIPEEPFMAESVGTGVMLISRDVLKKLSEDGPVFEFSYMHDKDLWDTRIGEDVNFCGKARAFGYEIWVDPTIPVRHVGEYLY